jgi:hypothetical protein
MQSALTSAERRAAAAASEAASFRSMADDMFADKDDEISR